MNSQHIMKEGKNTNIHSGYPLQLNFPANPNVVSATSLNIPVSSTHLPIQLPGLSGSQPLQIISTPSNVPVQLPSGGTISVPLHLGQPPGNLQLAGSIPLLSGQSSQPGLHGSVLQFNMSGPHNSNRMLAQGVQNTEKLVEYQNIIQEHNPVQMKLQGVNGPVTSALQLQMQNSLIGPLMQGPSSTNNIQVRGPTRPMPHVVYIQTPSGLKPVTSAEITNTSSSLNPQQIIVRRPVTSGNAIQIISSVNVTPKFSTTSKAISKSSILAPNIPSQSIVIQKSKPIPPVSIAISGAKHTLATYNKSSPAAKVQESQSILVSSNAPPSTANQKFFLTPKNVPKIPQNTKYNYPSAIAAKGPVINFQIANGQLQDPQGNVTVMQDASAFTSPTSEIPPLLPISKNIAMPSSVTLTNAAIHTPSSVTETSFSASLPTNDNTFPTSIPGSRAELIGEKEYTLSIPESNTSLNDDMYTVSITEDNDCLPENYTISITEKGNSVLGNNLTSVEAVLQEVECNLSSPGPTILRRSNSDSLEKKIILNEKRRISLCSEDKKGNDDIENKIEKAKIKLFNQNLNILNKPPALERVEETKLPSLFCEEKFDHEVEIKVIEKPKLEPPVKNNGFSNLARNPQINKDRRKSRLSADTYNISQNNALEKISDKTVFQFPHQNKDTSKTDFLTEEDSLGLQWQNEIALLNGSCLQIRTNEFGLIDIIDSKDSSISLTKYHAPLKQRINRDKKPSSPEDLYCCDGCGCHGMAAEFITPNFCSHTCQRNFRKNHNNKKERETFDFKKKRRQKKTLIQKLKPKESSNSLSENNVSIEESKLLESISSDVTITTTPIHAVKSNSTESNIKTPMWKCDKVGFSWMKYLEYYKGTAAAPNLFREKESMTNKNCFKMGMKVEAIDPVHPSLFAVVTITEVQGYRLKLHFDGYHEDHDFWVNADSCDIFPPGWCEKNGRVLRPPMGFTPSSFSWPLYLKQVRAIAAPKNLFAHVSTSVQKICPSGFRIGLKLEAEDRKNSLTCVATVADVMENRVLIHFDSWDDIYDYWVDPTSPYIHPVGWCDEHGYSLTPPNTYKDPEHFMWDEYLKETSSVPVTARAFRPRPPHNFKAGMKLEAVDKRVPFLIRVATISDTRFHQVRISFDGWPDDLSFWVDDDSPDIHPMGWCLRTSHPLEPPLTPEELRVPGQCGTGGCHGLGNSSGAKRTTHSIAAECPYRLPPCSPPLRDRLAGILPPPLHSEPRPRSIQVSSSNLLIARGRPPMGPDHQGGNSSDATKDKDRTPKGRPPKFKKADEIKTEIVESDGETTNSSQSKKRRRASSPVSQEKVERSVFEPGYLPNPNWAAPPAWSKHCIPLEEILQSQALRADPRNWSQMDVQDFVEKVAKSREILIGFCKGRIDGESLLMLSQEDLVNILGMKLGPAIKLYGSIIQLRKKITA